MVLHVHIQQPVVLLPPENRHIPSYLVACSRAALERLTGGCAHTGGALCKTSHMQPTVHVHIQQPAALPSPDECRKPLYLVTYG